MLNIVMDVNNVMALQVNKTTCMLCFGFLEIGPRKWGEKSPRSNRALETRKPNRVVLNFNICFSFDK